MTMFLPNHVTIEYATKIETLLQQKRVLDGTTEMGAHVGKQASPVNQFGSIEAADPAGRFAPLTHQDPTAARRWVSPIDKENAVLVDEFDLLRTIEDPKGKLAETVSLAMGRAHDAEIIRAATATSLIGVDGTGTEAFSTSLFQVANSFGAGAATGLNVAKIIEAKRKMRKAFVDFQAERAILCITSYQEADLMNQAQVVSSDFNRNGGVLTDGKVTGFMGCDIRVTELLAISGSDRNCLLWVPSGIHYGTWGGDVYTKISEREDLSSQPWQIYSRSTYGATRTQQGKVVSILCTEA